MWLWGETQALNRLWEQHSIVSALEMAEYRSQSATPSKDYRMALWHSTLWSTHMEMRKVERLSPDVRLRRKRLQNVMMLKVLRGVSVRHLSIFPSFCVSWLLLLLGSYWFICMFPGKAEDQYGLALSIRRPPCPCASQFSQWSTTNASARQ